MSTIAGLDKVSLLSVRNFPDVNGNLGFIEQNKDIPFSIERVFYVYGVHPGDVRGQHAHRECNQLLICVHGRVDVVCSDGDKKKEFVLDSPLKALYIPPSIWAEQKYETSETMLMALTDRLFDEADYLRDYEKFKAYRSGGGE
jgi:dTDP-4-dehydrorhamnose 3,5-epimerase-like enzyme